MTTKHFREEPFGQKGRRPEIKQKNNHYQLINPYIQTLNIVCTVLCSVLGIYREKGEGVGGRLRTAVNLVITR